MYIMDKLATASACPSVVTAGIYCQIYLVADVGNSEGETEGRKGEE
jgi:hypothetical protein